jgi:Xaa-Pro aminopeptidase
MNSLEALQEAERKAQILFDEIQNRGLISPEKTERQLNEEIYQLAFDLFSIDKYWHKRIVRAGANTLLPYKENPQDLKIQEDDILFLDFGPVFEDWEADVGKTYVLGNDPNKIKLQKEVELAWHEGKAFYDKNKMELTAADLYNFTTALAEKYGWKYANRHCGHLVGKFPHERILGDDIIHYIHPENHRLMSAPDQFGNERYWIYEIHFVDETLGIGGFFEQLLS